MRRERFESGRVAIESVCAEETRAGAESGKATTCWKVNQRRQGLSLRSVCVHGGHVRAESTCRRDTSDTSGQQFATKPREVATPFSFLYLFGNCVCLVWRPRPIE